MLGNKLKALREEKHLTQKQMSEILEVSKSNISKYESESVEPSIETLIRYAKYFNISVDCLLGREDVNGHGLNDGNIDEHGLDGPGITSILGYPENEEKAVLFSHKLALQIDFNGLRLSDVANAIGVSIETIWEWLIGKRADHHNYYEKLSDYFNVDLSYWLRPGAVSPGIEPTVQEYFLILKYRFQNQLNEIEDPPIEDFFPSCHELTEPELKWLNAFRQLNEDNKDIIIGKIKEYLKEQRSESVAADPSLKKTGTDKLGK